MAYALYPSNERAKLSSVVMLVALMAPALSPMIGGALVDYINWRWIFLVSVPLALLTLMLTAYWLKPDTQTGGAEPLDTGGLITGCVALTLLLLGLTYLGDSFHQGEGILFLVVGLVFTVYHIRNALGKIQPLLNLRLIQIPLLQTAMLIYLLIPGVFTGVNLITVIFLQNQLGMHATLVGMMMLPWSVASFLAISFTGKTFNRIGPRPLFLLGCIVQGWVSDY
nr:MFS transporter [Rosenbergiella gaditana]